MVVQEEVSKAMNAKVVGPCSSGKKETLVLAHGYGGDQSVWDKVLPSLSLSHQVVVFDWCFSGAVRDANLFDAVKYSSYDAFADDLIALMDELKLSSCVFVGHSMSGMVGCIASIKRPDLFNKLVLVASSPRFLNSEDYEGGFEMPDLEELFSNIELNFSQWTTVFASVAVDASDAASAEKFQKCLDRMGPEIALPLARTVFLSDQRAVLEKVTAPCTIMQTRNDFAVPGSVPKYMQSKIGAKSTVEIIDTEGHFPQLTAHDQFLDALNRALLS